MGITTSVPSTTRKPGTFHEFQITGAQRGLVPLQRRVVCLGAKSAAGSLAVHTPQRIFDENEADSYAGKGSELALMLRAALKAMRAVQAQGIGAPELYACAVADPGAGVKAIHKFTVTGTATEGGDVVFRIAGRTIRAGVSDGDANTVVATAMKDAIDAMLHDLPITAAVGGAGSNEVDCTAVNAGVNGNDIKIEVVSTPAGITVTATEESTAGSGAYDITSALDSLIDQHYRAIAIANHTATDVTDLKAHIDARGTPSLKQWVMGYLAETGTLSTATTLATGANYKEVVVATYENSPSLPGEIAAMLATMSEGESDVAKSFNAVELPLYPPPAASVYTDVEIETALAAGATPLVPSRDLTRTQVVRLVTTKTDEGGAPFYAVLDVSTVRTLFEVALQIDAAWKLHFPRAKNTARTKRQVKSVTLQVLKAAEAVEWLHNVDAHEGELLVENDAEVPTRLNVDIPQSVIPNLHQLVGVNRLILE